MNGLRIALAKFFGGLENIPGREPLSVPAFEEGSLPEMQPFPYLTYPVVMPAFGGQALLTVSVWDRDMANPGFKGRLDHVLNGVAELVPEGGVAITLGSGGGSVWLNRNGASFISYMGDPDDRFVVRGIVHLQIKAFIC